MILGEMVNLPERQFAEKSTSTKNDKKAMLEVFVKLTFWRVDHIV